MSRANRNNQESRVRGPNSALTEFLREKGVSAARIREEARARQLEAERQAAEAAQENGTVQDERDTVAESSTATRRTTRGSSTITTTTTTATVQIKTPARRRGRASLPAPTEDDEEDEDMADVEPLSTSRSNAKSKAKAKKEAEMKKKKKRKYDSDDDSDLDFEIERSAVPLPGQISFCAECNCRFTVTPYSKPASNGDGLLCAPCGKKSAPAEAAVKKKRQAGRSNKKSQARALLDRDEGGVKSLQELCINLVAKHIDDVEALGSIGSHNMDKICQIISKNRSLSNHTIQLFYEPGEHALKFYDCSKVDASQLRQIASFVPTLRHLHLKFCGRMNDDCLTYFGTQLKNLESVEIYGAFNVTRQCYVDFFRTVGSKLKEFSIGDTSRFEKTALESLVDNCPELEVLRLRTITHIDDECVRLLTGLPNLRVLEISNAGRDISDEAIIDVLNSCGSGLHELNLDCCIQMTDSLLSAIHESCGKLQILSLEEMDLLTDDGISNLFNNWDINPGLTNLSLGRCTGLESPGFARMIEHSGGSLEALSINSCKELGEEAWSFLSNFALRALEELDVSFIRSVNDAVVEDFIRIAPGLKVLKAWGNYKITEAVQLREDLHLIGREADILS